MQDFIVAQLESFFLPQHLEVVNESSAHNVAPGSETHFKVVVVSTIFEGQSSVKRHQNIYACLKKALEGGVHALAIHTYTPAEWASNTAAPSSPACMGGE